MIATSPAHVRIQWSQTSSMLSLRDSQGRPLYKVTSGGNIRRTRKVTKATRLRVLARDNHACVWCTSTDHVEVDHVIRYADGGSSRDDNLRTLCKPCHDKRAGGGLRGA